MKMRERDCATFSLVDSRTLIKIIDSNKHFSFPHCIRKFFPFKNFGIKRIFQTFEFQIWRPIVFRYRLFHNFKHKLFNSRFVFSCCFFVKFFFINFFLHFFSLNINNFVSSQKFSLLDDHKFVNENKNEIKTKINFTYFSRLFWGPKTL